ncbi:MAG: RNA polymerase factor sigma-54 [Tissierellia bacterium]|nr:RNA polymerase factor sigma-54 [Tissierellia bacterium]
MKMDMNMSVDTKLIQQLNLTPALIQSIEMLSLNRVELMEFIKEEVQENPLLEAQGLEDEYYESIGELSSEEDLLKWKSYAEKLGDYSYHQEYVDASKRENDLECCTLECISLYEHLMQQVPEIYSEDIKRIVLETIIEHIDDEGYFDGDAMSIAKTQGITVAEVEEHLMAIQSLDPPGIGARNLQESLLIQLNRMDIEDDLTISIIKDNLEDISRNRMQVLAKNYSTSIEKISESFEKIRSLNPRPACNFSVEGENKMFIWPDARVQKNDGKWELEFINPIEPHLSVNRTYSQYVDNDDEELAEFVKVKLRRIKWIFESLEMRRINMEKVFNAIIELQSDYLEKGPYHLKPMTLKNVGSITELHESTVSRIINGKYLETPHGVLSLKCMFASDLGGDNSSASVKHLIKDRIENEDKAKPYSDQQLSNWLKEKGISVARRTVMKYREELEIPSSQLRRRH